VKTTLLLKAADEDRTENETILLMYGKQNTSASREALNGVV